MEQRQAAPTSTSPALPLNLTGGPEHYESIWKEIYYLRGKSVTASTTHDGVHKKNRQLNSRNSLHSSPATPPRTERDEVLVVEIVLAAIGSPSARRW